jgi:hypothetical protein
MAILWDVAPSGLEDINQHFTLMTEAVSSSETSISIFQTALTYHLFSLMFVASVWQPIFSARYNSITLSSYSEFGAALLIKLRTNLLYTTATFIPANLEDNETNVRMP